MYDDYDPYFTPSPDRHRSYSRSYPNSDRRRHERSRRYPSAVSSRGRNGYETERRYEEDYYTRGRHRHDDVQSRATVYESASQRRPIPHDSKDWQTIGVYYNHDDDLNPQPRHRPPSDQGPHYVRGSRHHGYPKHVFTGQRGTNDKNYYFTQKAETNVIPNPVLDGNLKQYKVVGHGRHKPHRDDGEIYIHSDYESEDEEYWTRKRKKGHKVHVKIEHWKGVIGQSVYDELKGVTTDIYDANEVTFEERKGWLDTFEVYINDQLMFSRSRSGGYPNTQDFLEEVRRARHGKPVHRIREGDSRMCTIL